MSRLRQWRHAAGVTGIFVVLTAVMTWPQARVLTTHAADNFDVYFNLWRLRWIAHALASSPLDLFNGNIFYPERGVLAYSDAILVEGILAAPLLWLGLPPVLVHNLVLLGAIVASGVGMYYLGRHLTGSAAGGFIAGVIFSFAPYRFDHYFHLELQWTVWSPWAFWALQRAIETGAPRFGVLTGVFVALQVASSVYYGVFLSVLIAVVGLLQLLALRGRELLRRAGVLLLAGTIAASLSGLYLLPYAEASKQVGLRSEHQVRMFSARPRDYRMATSSNLLYKSNVEGVAERQLFTGILPLLLALVGLLLVSPGKVAIAYLIGLTLAFELSLGLFGQLYPILYEHVPLFRGLRAPARASVFCLLFLGVLAAYGLAALTTSRKRYAQLVAGVLACGVVILEYWVTPLHLVAYYNEPPPLYRLLARLPRGVVAEFPMPHPQSPFHHDPRFAYMSTFHWMPLLNGYSGFLPRSYMDRLRALSRFPDADTVDVLRKQGARYVIVHSDGYPTDVRIWMVDRLLQLGLLRLADFNDGWNLATVLELPDTADVRAGVR